MTTFEQWSLLAAYLNLIAAFGGLGLIYHGIREMAKGAEMRAADSERKHNETMAESERKHNEFMAALERRDDESERRHNEFMSDSERKHNESMASLRELIERTR